MLTSVLSFTPEQAAQVTEYCTNVSNDVSPNMKELWQWTTEHFKDADKMSSPLQGATMKFLAEHQQAKRILDIGCYTGYSTLAWYESTVSTQAEIITLEMNPKMIAASRCTFDKYGLNDRVTLIEGPAQETMHRLTGTFDIIFVDADKKGYEGYVRTILDKKLLSADGFILCDNVFARGMTISPDANPYLPDKVRDYWTANGEALREFNIFCKSDPRIDSVLLPVFDGVTLIKWKRVVATSSATEPSTTLLPVPILAYPRPSTAADYEYFSGKDLCVMIDGAVAQYLKLGLPPVSSGNDKNVRRRIIGLLAQSTLDFILSFFTLSRLSYIVLALLLRIAPAPVVNLLRETGYRTVVHADTARILSTLQYVTDELAVTACALPLRREYR
ncbi:S-adenosyl-L-methionine-dependent methyltransferase [Aspergillus californicus]